MFSILYFSARREFYTKYVEHLIVGVKEKAKSIRHNVACSLYQQCNFIKEYFKALTLTLTLEKNPMALN